MNALQERLSHTRCFTPPSYLAATRLRDEETEQFPLVIKHFNINNPEAWSCIAQTAHVSAPHSLHLKMHRNHV